MKKKRKKKKEKTILRGISYRCPFSLKYALSCDKIGEYIDHKTVYPLPLKHRKIPTARIADDFQRSVESFWASIELVDRNRS